MRRLRQELFRIGGIDLWMAIAASAIAALMIVAASEAQGQTFQVLHTFTGGDDGADPVVGLTMDRAGNLYGTAQYGGTGNCNVGAQGCGTVFKLSHKGTGWTFTPLYSFQGWNASDGAYPQSRVSIGTDGNLYGATSIGGPIGECKGGLGCGTAYRLQPPATICKSVSCPWTETALHNFMVPPDGNYPSGDLIFDGAGNLYGTTVDGGSSSDVDGTVFELSPSNGGWMESILYSFPGGGTGGLPYSGVIFDAAGNLDGTATNGGSSDLGTIFQLTPSGSGWTGSALYSFAPGDEGDLPIGGLITDNAGNLYGATRNSTSGQPVVYELTPANGGWTFTIMHVFDGADDGGPVGKLLMDSAGNVYGTALSASGNGDCCGSVFKLTPSNGGWIYTDLHDFIGGSGGAYPYDGLIMDANGNLYGTTSAGGSSACQGGCGVVFEITP
ncbi:MAG: choice-of-anchor tandem repeat GloVer-containing protein [Candidatus Korobacteraceae bacterium]